MCLNFECMHWERQLITKANATVPSASGLNAQLTLPVGFTYSNCLRLTRISSSEEPLEMLKPGPEGIVAAAVVPAL